MNGDTFMIVEAVKKIKHLGVVSLKHFVQSNFNLSEKKEKRCTSKNVVDSENLTSS